MWWLETTSPHDPLAGRLVDVLGDPRSTLAELRALADDVGAPRPVTALACALVGLERGVDALDVEELVTHELTWAVDTLARDHATVLWRGAGGTSAALTGRYPASRARTP